MKLVPEGDLGRLLLQAGSTGSFWLSTRTASSSLRLFEFEVSRLLSAETRPSLETGGWYQEVSLARTSTSWRCKRTG
jgi:hypothetical protein